jgi:ankyrin repeat protein
MLLDAGADVHATASSWKFTPLAMAAFRGNVRIVRMLLGAGAEVDARDSTGSTPLMWAAYSERANIEVVDALRKAGADVSAKNKRGETALTWAAWNGETPVTQLLKRAAESR